MFAGVLLAPLLAGAHGTFDARMAELDGRLALKPNDPALHFTRAELYCEHEQPAEALAEITLVETLGVGDLPVDYLRGMCLRLAGKPAEALTSLNRYVTAHPENAPARLQRARVQIALGDMPAGLDDYRAALRLSVRPEPDLVQETADTLVAAGKIAEAVQVLDNGLAVLGPVPSLMLRAVDVETATGRFDDALTRVAALQKIAPRPEPWMARRAAILTQAGRIDEARAAWTALISHLAALPNLERGSHSFSLLAEQARQALARLNSPSVSSP